MSVQFRTVPITIPSGSGRKIIDGVAIFDSDVLSAGVALNGFSLRFDNRDKRFLNLEADTDFNSISGNTVSFRVECNLANDSGDDPYSGYVTALVTADIS